MGTNYFCCYKKNEYHIGKLSCGWRFVFHGYYSNEIGFNLKNYDEWERFLSKKSICIYDESDEKIDIKDFIKMVNCSKSEDNKIRTIRLEERGWLDKNGFAFLNYEFS